MKPLNVGLRSWIAVTSMVSFLGGWAILSHAQKPAPLFASQPAAQTSSLSDPNVTSQSLLPTLQPIPELSDLTSTTNTTVQSIQPLTQLPALTSSNNLTSNNFAAPRLRTRGS